MALFGGKKSKKSKVVTEIEQILSDADTYLKNGNTEKSASEYRRAHRYLYREEKVTDDPDEFSELYTRTGHGLFETGEPDRAIECFDKATQLMPDNVDAWLSRGMVHLSNKTMLNYAVMCFSEVLKRYPNSVEALENKAEALTLDNRDDEAKEIYQKLIEINPSRKDDYTSKLGEEVTPDLSTVEGIDEALRSNPKDVELWKKKAELLEAKNATEEAVECYLRLGHLTSDDSNYKKVLELDPENIHAKDKLGIEDEPEPEQEPVVEPVIEMEPESIVEEPIAETVIEPETEVITEPEPVIEEPVPEPVIESMVEAEPEPEQEPAAEPFAEPEPTIEVEPATEEPVGETVIEPETEVITEPEPVIEESVAEPVIEESTPEPAAETEPEPVAEEPVTEPVINAEPEVIVEPEPVFEEPVAEPVIEEPAAEIVVETPSEEIPMSEDDLLNKGKEYFESEDYERALECFGKLAEMKPDDADILHNKAAVLYSMKRYADAIEVFDRLIAMDGEDVTAYLTKGASLYWDGKYDDAVNALNNVVKRDMNNPAAWYYKACAEARKGNDNLIYPFLTRAVGIDADFKERAMDEDAFAAVKEEQKFKDIIA